MWALFVRAKERRMGKRLMVMAGISLKEVPNWLMLSLALVLPI